MVFSLARVNVVASTFFGACISDPHATSYEKGTKYVEQNITWSFGIKHNHLHNLLLANFSYFMTFIFLVDMKENLLRTTNHTNKARTGLRGAREETLPHKIACGD